MPRTSYPTVSDLEGLLGQAGIEITDPAALSAALLAGIQSFEETCGRHFLAGKTIENAPEAEATRVFDSLPAHERTLFLGPFNDLWSITGVAYQPKPDGAVQALELYRDYFPEPANNPAARGRGYDRLRRSGGGPWGWYGPGWGYWSGWGWLSPYHSLEITGLWGFGITIPDDAWLAMLFSATLWVEGQYRLLSTGGRTSYTAGRVTEQFGVESYTNIVKGWQDHLDRAAATYRLLEF